LAGAAQQGIVGLSNSRTKRNKNRLNCRTFLIAPPDLAISLPVEDRCLYRSFDFTQV
jgi:hypothetical protein